MVQSVITQFHLLPSEAKQVKIPKIAKLGATIDIEQWRLNVRIALRPLLLHNLVRHDLARPEKTHATYETWLYYSIIVGEWLYNHVAEIVQGGLDNSVFTKGDGVFADTIMKKIEEMYLEERVAGRALLGKIRTLRAIKRSQYDSVSDFTFAVHTLTQELRHANVTIPWIYPVTIILDELQELPTVTFIELQLLSLPAEDFTEDKFVKICEKIQKSTDKAAAEDAEKTGRRRGRLQK